MGRAKGSKNPNAGNKTLYYSLILPRFDYIKEQLQNGATQRQIADSLGIKYPSTWCNYKRLHPELKELVDNPDNRQQLVDKLKGKLVTSAEGHVRTVRKYMKLKHCVYNDNGKKIEEYETLEPYDEEIYFPPNVTAIFGALNIYDKDYVKDRANYEIKKRELVLKEEESKNKKWD